MKRPLKEQRPKHQLTKYEGEFLKMVKKPNVKPGDWIDIGERPFVKQAVVCNVFDNSDWADLEVVYLNDEKAINEDVVWNNGNWKFKISGPNGGYADNYPRLSQYVAQLRRGRFWDLQFQ